jgi:Ca-activated chloride channel family protein
LAAIVFLFTRCSRVTSPVATTEPAAPSRGPEKAAAATPAAQPPEVLTPAFLKVPAQVIAGATFPAEWTGPNNTGDYLTVVRPTSDSAAYQNYRDTRDGSPLELTAPIEAGEWEVRYVTVKSKTVLARAPLTVTPSGAVLSAADEVVLGAPVTITWTGPSNAGDFITILPKNAPDNQAGEYADTAKGSPLVIHAPVQPGDAGKSRSARPKFLLVRSRAWSRGRSSP